MRQQRVMYYRDPLKDEFSTAKIQAKKIDGTYVYTHASLWKKWTHFFWYRMVATPIAWGYMKLKFHYRIENRHILKQNEGEGYFLYGNHTHSGMDACMPTMITFPKDAYVVVHPDNVSIPVIGHITPSLGALPLPDDAAAARNFVKAVEQRVMENKVMVIYPEAHIWPYYTKIRPFTDASFRYPVKLRKPVYCFTNTYQKRRFGKKPKVVTYLDGPFYPKEGLPLKEQRKELRNQVYEAMVKRSCKNSVELIRYEMVKSDD